MSSEPAIRARGLGKRYALFERPADRLRQLLWGTRGGAERDFWALRGADFEIGHGEVVGIVGRNGAGKSTLLQLVCGTLTPSEGRLEVHGRVSALLELGAGFNPEFSGVENVFLNGALLGLSRAQMEDRLDGILAFADIGAFVHQPVKTYSSGMFMRLAFAVATSVEPDILVIDEALSVGDGAFARRSFDRIMGLKDGGATILFCSHAMYHVHALCSRAMWLEGGRLRMMDAAARVTAAYEATLAQASTAAPGPDPCPSASMEDGAAPPGEAAAQASPAPLPAAPAPEPAPMTLAPASPTVPAESAVPPPTGSAALRGIEASVDGEQVAGRGAGAGPLRAHSGRSTLTLRVRFASDPALPSPSVAVGIEHASGTVVASALSVNDGVVLARDAQGHGEAVLSFERLPLLKGDYTLSVILACERGLHVYEIAQRVLALRVEQTGLEQGLVTLPHQWDSRAGAWR